MTAARLLRDAHSGDWWYCDASGCREVAPASACPRSVIQAFHQREYTGAADMRRAVTDIVPGLPVPADAAVYGVGLNYADHAREVGREVPAEPHLFLKAPGGLVGSGTPLLRPVDHECLDYEGELGVVIGSACHRVPARDAARFIAGYTVLNDVTLRSLARPETLVLAKSAPVRAAIGPALVALPLAAASDLALRTWVNGALRQDSRTAQMVHGIADLVALLSAVIELRPGDVIATGSPFGSGAGQSPARYLEAGDSVRIEIEQVGAIENPVEDEAAG